MTREMTLVLGGARSGKSDYAQQQAEAYGKIVLYVATATAGDEEMAARIQAHQHSRPAYWHTLEEPLGVGSAIKAFSKPYEFLILDCMTLLATNILLSLPEDVDPKKAEEAVDEEITALLAAYQQSDAAWMIVSNEVGLGLVPPYPLGRLYRDVLGRANQHLARVADHVLFMVAGIPMTVK
jgi:adenosylcobinamide kinase/adenosylcobinamide-phosphate guanylyltransferase